MFILKSNVKANVNLWLPFSGPMLNEPIARPGSAKYNGYRGGVKGWYSAKSFPNCSNLSAPYLNALISAANNRYACIKCNS